MKILRRLLFRNPAFIVSTAVNDFFAHAICYFAQINKIVGDINQLRRCVRTKTSDLYAASFVSDGVNRVNKIFVT